MKQIITGDNSITFENPVYEQAYHSLSGALSEAKLKYAEPCKIAEKAKSGSLTILDICFGLGYNSLLAIHTAKASNPKCKIKIYALEMDPQVFGLINKIDMDQEYAAIYNMIKRLSKDKLSIKQGGVDLQLHLGDARETILEIKDKADAVFLDPFSPPKNPELWTEEFFSNIHARMKKSAILATYSCAALVRINLVRAGFDVKDGPHAGRYAPSTLAFPLP
ncbi:hypothetical protein J4460_03550 [Candidatus Woesearchaeota archaeon]|nr:MAG: hypothetical protein QS99_C0009G0040 [archaeon GW2011_AR4]MBS3129724.1 hypothetical protein [Candidatus Woesearchaeota archaeon]HIH37417.1 hypothetical protein [Candidatus Woesearchaeota archaeon]HIH48285.1 hypothetical protein [Candidatus Woesearchaeota archaeon]HIJ02894.1 hypothetical protein [Candidatus Woesearchaeota archaeon]